jgi:hypothetical protein
MLPASAGSLLLEAASVFAADEVDRWLSVTACGILPLSAAACGGLPLGCGALPRPMPS